MLPIRIYVTYTKSVIPIQKAIIPIQNPEGPLRSRRASLQFKVNAAVLDLFLLLRLQALRLDQEDPLRLNEF